MLRRIRLTLLVLLALAPALRAQVTNDTDVDVARSAGQASRLENAIDIAYAEDGTLLAAWAITLDDLDYLVIGSSFDGGLSWTILHSRSYLPTIVEVSVVAASDFGPSPRHKSHMVYAAVRFRQVEGSTTLEWVNLIGGSYWDADRSLPAAPWHEPIVFRYVPTLDAAVPRPRDGLDAELVPSGSSNYRVDIAFRHSAWKNRQPTDQIYVASTRGYGNRMSLGLGPDETSKMVVEGRNLSAPSLTVDADFRHRLLAVADEDLDVVNVYQSDPGSLSFRKIHDTDPHDGRPETDPAIFAFFGDFNLVCRAGSEGRHGEMPLHWYHGSHLGTAPFQDLGQLHPRALSQPDIAVREDGAWLVVHAIVDPNSHSPGDGIVAFHGPRTASWLPSTIINSRIMEVLRPRPSLAIMPDDARPLLGGSRVKWEAFAYTASQYSQGSFVMVDPNHP